MRGICLLNEVDASTASTKAGKSELPHTGISDFRPRDPRHTSASCHVQSGTSLPELIELGAESRMIGGELRASGR